MYSEQIKEQVSELNNEGYSYAEIAEELGLSNVDVLGILQSLENENDESPEESPAQLTGVDKANQLQERKLAIEEKKLKKETVERKRTILNKFKNFCLGILDNISGSTWERAAIKKAYREIEEIEDQVQDQFEIEDEELQDNSIFEILSVLKNEFKPLTEKDPDYKVKMNWSPEKVTMLKYASEIKNFDETEWDRDKYELRRAFGYYKRFLDNLEDYKGENVDIEIVENLESSLSFAKEVINEYDENFGSGDFEKELEVLSEIEDYFKELKIRIEEAFFGEKVLKISESIATLIEEVDEDLVSEGE